MTPFTEERLNEIVQSISKLDKTNLPSDLERRLLLCEAQRLVTRLQTPLELVTTICHTNTFMITAMKALLALDLFDKWEKDGGQPTTSNGLAQLTGAPLSLLERLLRVVTTAGWLSTDSKDHNGDDLYIFTDFAKANSSGKLWHYWHYHTLVLSHCPTALPEHLKKFNSCEPTDPAKSPWATHMGKSIFEWLPENPQAFTHLNEVMSFKDQDSIPWFSTFPGEQLLDCERGRTIVVDVGGGKGSDMKLFQQKFDSQLTPDQLVVQDLAQAIDEAGELPSAIRKQVYDFFSEQPVRGARAYYLHNVLHDWADEACLKILARVKEAMEPDSRLLIHENVLSLESTPFATATDVAMMVLNSGAERTEVQWRTMLEKAGLRIVKIHLLPGVDEGVIEAQI